METTLKDIFSRITSQIVQAIEAGALNYRMPWHTSGLACEPVNAVTKRPYQGINVVSLWASAQAKGYESGVWATYNQWHDLGAPFTAASATFARNSPPNTRRLRFMLDSQKRTHL